MKPNKITNRTQVYRAIYYASFDWERKRNETSDIYTIKSKIDDFTAILEHLPQGDLSDIITIKSDSHPCEKDATRLVRLLKKIQRRTKNITIKQDLVNLNEEVEEKHEGSEK